MATAKQKAAARKNIKKAQAARKRKTSSPRRRKTSSAAPRRRSTRSNRGLFAPRTGGPSKGVAGVVNQSSKIVANGAWANGLINPAITVVTGRNLMHPLGGLQSNAALVQSGATARPIGAGGANSTVPMTDVLGIAIGSVLPSTLGSQFAPGGSNPGKFAAIRAGLAYNARSAFGSGWKTTWQPLAVGAGVKVVDAVVVPALVKGVSNVMRPVRSLTRGFGA